MKKINGEKILLTAGMITASAMLAGCFPMGNNGGNSGNIISSEPVSVTVVENPSETDWQKPSSSEQGQFPGGLDDDGREPGESDVMAVSIDLQIVSNTENASHRGIVYGYDADGNLLWTYETEEIMIGQLDNIQDIITTDYGYIFLAEGNIVCLDLYTGKELWVNHDFQGASLNWTIDYEGKYIYMCGYFGPALFVMDLASGETVNRINPEDDGYYWPCKVTYVNSNQVDVYFEGNDKTLSFNPNGPEKQ